MALRLSTGLRNAMAGGRSTLPSVKIGTTVSFDNATKQIRDSGNGLLAAGFRVGDKVTVKNSANNNSTFTVTVVAAGALTVSEAITTESAGATIFVGAHRGSSLNDLFAGGVLEIRTGSQPASADDAETGTLLATITLSSGAHNTTTGENGLMFGASSTNGVLSKDSGQVWSGDAANSGTAGYFRLYSVSKTTGASTSAVRLDGTVGVSTGDLRMASTAITSGQSVTIDTATLTIPAS